MEQGAGDGKPAASFEIRGGEVWAIRSSAEFYLGQLEETLEAMAELLGQHDFGES